MKPQKQLDYLRALREEIAALRVVKCQMSHERVVRASDTGLPIVCSFPRNSYQRVGLCSDEVRALALGCSHTMARIKLEMGLNQMETWDSSLNVSLSSELNLLDNEIHLLDHRKGEAEKVFARLLAEAFSTDGHVRECARVRRAEEKIRELEGLHAQYVERIGVLRDKVVAELDKLIEQAAVNDTSGGLAP